MANQELGLREEILEESKLNVEEDLELGVTPV